MADEHSERRGKRRVLHGDQPLPRGAGRRLLKTRRARLIAKAKANSQLPETETAEIPSEWLTRDGVNLGLRPSPPLIDHAHKLLIYWSPKSACTSVYAWFSAFAGFVDELKQRKPHKHRTQTFNRSEFYAKGLALDPLDLFAIKVLRDPFSRAVSIYRHALSTGFAEKDIASVFDGKFNNEEGFSFHQFLDLVEALDLGRCNAHYRPQTLPRELVRKPDHVINISKQDLFAGLNDAVSAKGMMPVDAKALDWLDRVEHRRKAKTQLLEGTGLDHAPFNRSAARNDAPFPTYDQLLTDSVRERIRRIYAIDFETYGKYL